MNHLLRLQAEYRRTNEVMAQMMREGRKQRASVLGRQLKKLRSDARRIAKACATITAGRA